MEIIFTDKEIKYSNKSINYDELKGENANKLLYKLLSYCVENEEKLKFIVEEQCTPFGKKLKEIIENEFSNKTFF